MTTEEFETLLSRTKCITRIHRKDTSQTRRPGEYYFGRDTDNVHGLQCWRWHLDCPLVRHLVLCSRLLCHSRVFSSLAAEAHLLRNAVIYRATVLRGIVEVSEARRRSRQSFVGSGLCLDGRASTPCWPPGWHAILAGKQDDRTRDRNEPRHAVVQQNRLRCVL